MRNRLLQLLALLFAFTLIAAACGDDDDDGDGEPEDGTTSSTEVMDEEDTTTTAAAEDDVETEQGDGSLLDVVRERGTLICAEPRKLQALQLLTPTASTRALTPITVE